MFGKLESSAQINITGIGLGLNICKQIVEMFDGKIYLDDKFGPGAQFIFHIKAQEILPSVRAGSHNRLFTDNFPDELESLKFGSGWAEEIKTGDIDFSCQDMNSHYEPELNKHFNYIFKSSVFNTITKNCPCGERKDILVVDDNIFNIVTLQAILELQFGITSDKASNG